MERSKKIQKSKQSDSDDRIPLDLILEILSRLPAKSIVRLRSVSKLWSSITTSPEFINSFSTRSSSSSSSSSSGTCVMLIFIKNKKLFVFSSPVHRNTYYPEVENHQFAMPNSNAYLRRYESVHGLIYLETLTQPMILNLTMKRLFTLPKLEGKFETGFLGYEPIEGKHKVICILEGGNKIGILTLGAQESWTILSNGFPRHVCTIVCGQCINGVIYYESYTAHWELVIMIFDLRTEKWSWIKYPMKNRCECLVSYEGRLALLTHMGSAVKLWILEDAENQKWIYKQFASSLAHKTWKLEGISGAGEFVYTTSTTYRWWDSRNRNTSLCETFRTLCVDPKENSTEEVRFGEISVEEIRELDEIGFGCKAGLFIIPNHIPMESLMFL